MVDFYVGWNWTAAERSFRRALDLNPNDEIAQMFYAPLLSDSLRHDKAIAEVERGAHGRSISAHQAHVRGHDGWLG